MASVSSRFGYIVFALSFNSGFWFSSWILSWPTQFSFSRELFSFHEFACFLIFLLFLICSFNPWYSWMQGDISFFVSVVFSVSICDWFGEDFQRLLSCIFFSCWVECSVVLIDLWFNSSISLFNFLFEWPVYWWYWGIGIIHTLS